jgi:hypothetical protein
VTIRQESIAILLLLLIILLPTFGQGSRNAQSLPESSPCKDVHVVKGTVVEVLHARAGVNIQLRSSEGKLYHFGLGADCGTVAHMSAQRIKAWESVLGKVKPGDPIIIEYSEKLDKQYPGIIYGSALRARPN